MGILVSVTIPAQSEIHRTKSNLGKSAIRQGSGNSYVATSREKEDNINAQALSKDMFERYEVWCYSIGGAILVGLSGIFPLLVIPIEAGPALKRGGKGLQYCFLHKPLQYRGGP